MNKDFLLREITEDVIFHWLRDDDFPYLDFYIGLKLYNHQVIDAMLYNISKLCNVKTVYGDQFLASQTMAIFPDGRINFKAMGQQWQVIEHDIKMIINEYFKNAKINQK